jgi:hypothetical protein
MFKKRPAGRHLKSRGETQLAASQGPAPTPPAALSTQVRTRTDAKAGNAYAIATVMESRLQSPFG